MAHEFKHDSEWLLARFGVQKALPADFEVQHFGIIDYFVAAVGRDDEGETSVVGEVGSGICEQRAAGE